MNQEKIGKFISECRKNKKMTQSELAEKLGVSDKSVSKWETGKCMPDLSLFKPLCSELGITINDLMSGEEVDDNKYIESLENNIIDIVNITNKSKKKKMIKIISIFVLVIIALFSILLFNNYYEFDVKYDSRVMTCEINNKEIQFLAKGQSILNMYHTCRENADESICFIHATVSVYNKQRSSWEYFESMARQLEGKKIPFTSGDTIEASNSNIKVYYTDSSIKKINGVSNDELEKIINSSYLMCESK